MRLDISRFAKIVTRSAAHAAFSLVEIVIAMAILAFLTLFAARSLENAINSKARTQTRLDRQSGLQNALDIMADDISKAFNYRSIQIALHNQAQKTRQSRDQKARQKQKTGAKTGGKNQGNKGKPNRDPNSETPEETPEDKDPKRDLAQAEPPPPPREYPLKKDKVVTRFMGEVDQLNFSSLSYMRSQHNEAAGDQAEIGYFLRECKGRFKKTESNQCLWRRMSPYMDDDITQGGTAAVLLENVAGLEFKYLARNSSNSIAWADTWNSETADGSCPDTQRFPTAVSIRLEQSIAGTEQTTSMHKAVQLRSPNNKACNTSEGS